MFRGSSLVGLYRLVRWPRSFSFAEPRKNRLSQLREAARARDVLRGGVRFAN